MTSEKSSEMDTQLELRLFNMDTLSIMMKQVTQAIDIIIILSSTIKRNIVRSDLTLLSDTVSPVGNFTTLTTCLRFRIELIHSTSIKCIQSRFHLQQR